MGEIDKGQETRKQILDASLRVFADKGYDGARMEEIARTAGVNKSLIYYYFKSKREILDVLVEGFYTEFIGVLNFSLNPELFNDGSVMDRAFEEMFRFLETQTDLVSILMIESIKKGSGITWMIEMIERIFTTEEKMFETVFAGKGIPLTAESRGQRMVTEFYTLMGPVLLYITLGEKWSGYFKTDRDTLKNQFVTAIRQTHVARHREEFDSH